MIKTLEEISLTKGEYGGGFSAIDYSEDKPRYIRITDITEGGILKEDAKSPSGNAEDWEKYKLSEGDILFARSGATVGKTFLYHKSYGDCVYAGYLIRFKPNPEIAFPKYIYYFTKTPKYNSWVLNKQNVVAQPNINAKQYGQELKIPLPPLETQKKIASILDAADGYRQKTKALIAKYDELTQSLFLEMFGDPVTNPKGWEKVKVKSFAKIVRGSSPRPKGDPRYYGEGVPRLMVADLTRDGFYVTPQIDSLTVEGAKKSRPMSKGELVMAVSGRPGLPAILEVDCCIHDGFAGFKEIKDEYNLFYLCNYFFYYISQINKRSVGAIFKNITTDDIRNIQVPIVPIDLQDQFAERIQEIEKQKAQAQESFEKAEELFNSLLDRAFKNKLT
tara:strand:+ start:3292 stop:4461 length:1170 start_codon:yes stop_codon:yes gene_type:complete